MTFAVSCPLIPLFPKGQSYTPNYQLPRRQRQYESLNLSELVKDLLKALLYPKEITDSNPIGCVSVLSPYSMVAHIMCMNLSSKKYLPSPEIFTLSQFQLLCNTAAKCIQSMKQESHSCICAGYNWSPYGYGIPEEFGGAQSLTTKFHLMMWCWDKVEKEKIIIPESQENSFKVFPFSEPFARLIKSRITKIDVSNFFDEPEIDGPILFYPLKEGKTIERILEDHVLLHNLASTISDTFNHLSDIIAKKSVSDLFAVLKRCEERMLTDEEIGYISENPEIYSLDECLDKCNDSLEIECIKKIYPAVINRLFENDQTKPMWRKYFGYCLVLCECPGGYTRSGLFVKPLPVLKTGGVAEAVGCVLTRPESRVAPKEIQEKFNDTQWRIAERIL